MAGGCREEVQASVSRASLLSLRQRGQKAPSPSAAEGLVYYVPGVVVWKGRRIAAADLLLSTYGVVASRRVVGDAELNPPSEPEYGL